MTIRQVDEKMDVDMAMNVAIDAAKAGGNVLLDYFRRGVYSTRSKKDTSLQTTADVVWEQVILQIIQEAYPNHSICSEEQGLLPSPSSEFQWLVDPLDGTRKLRAWYSLFFPVALLCAEIIRQKLLSFTILLLKSFTRQ